MKRIILGDNAEVLPTLPEGFARLIYIDPPFNTGEAQRRERIRVVTTDGEGDRGGFAGRRYTVSKVESGSYEDDFGDFEAFLMPRIESALRCLAPDGSLFVHLDCREVHYIKVALDRLLGRKRFKNEIIWAYDFGGRPKNRWPAKHDTILWYTKDPNDYVFHFDEMDRIPYMAPGLVSKEKAERGKTPTDVWWHTIVPTGGREKTGYPTQKPLGVLNRIIKVHSSPGDVVLDFFAGSGTTGEAAVRHDRGFVLIDSNPEAVQVAAARLSAHEPECTGFLPASREAAPPVPATQTTQPTQPTQPESSAPPPPRDEPCAAPELSPHAQEAPLCPPSEAL
ncbi:MAG TPA: site-specific DNA-methyltransferase [Polyangiaceae bacterium]|nr:site-specific DNA-methyltransferase [Polyangiaceae bacterium]